MLRKSSITPPFPLCCWIQWKTTCIWRYQLKVVLPLWCICSLNIMFNSKASKITIRKVCRRNRRSYQQWRQQLDYPQHLTLKLQHLWLDRPKFLTLKWITNSNEQQSSISLASERNVSKIFDAIGKQRLLSERSRRREIFHC